MGHHPRCTGTGAPKGWLRLPWEAAQPHSASRDTPWRETEARTSSVGWCRACGAVWERCDSCKTWLYIKYSLRETGSPGSAPRLQMLRCCSEPRGGPAWALGDSSFQGKVCVHTPSTLNVVYKATEENPKQQNYKLGEVKINCCMQDSTSEAGEGKCMQIFLASSKDQPDWQS